MGFEYFGGKRWSEITRDERFFCQRLYSHIVNESASCFVSFLNSTLGLDVPLETEWEAGFEVCFYRDLWHERKRQGTLFSPKRTFDLCLFGKSAIVIIEAKAVQQFDLSQIRTFEQDIDEVQSQTGIKNVRLVGLCSSQYEIEPEVVSAFNGSIITWKELAARYDNDQTLLRADQVFEEDQAFSGFGLNSDTKLMGEALISAYRGGARWWVGRGHGGRTGKLFKEDVRTGRWRKQRYEVNTTAEEAPSTNYFSLKNFAESVGEPAE